MKLDFLDAEWITDTHLNRCSNKRIDEYAHSFRGTCKSVFISGDVSEGETFFKDLLNFQRGCGTPVYFVLGNHDFWGHNILKRRDAVLEFTQKNRYLTYLTLSGVQLINGVAVTGHDGIYGPIDECVDYSVCNDFVNIRDLQGKFRIRNLASLNSLYRCEYSEKLNRAGETSDEIVFFTHMPPYPWACVGINSHFVYNPVLGSCIKEYLASNPSKSIRVYCGHTHRQFSWKEGNLGIYVGKRSQVWNSADRVSFELP